MKYNNLWAQGIIGSRHVEKTIFLNFTVLQRNNKYILVTYLS